MYTGPNLAKQENLVFGFDTGYGVADPGLSTRFYKGKPTVNISSGAATLHDSAGGAAATVVDAPEKGVGWKKVTITARGTNFRVIQFGSYVNFSANTLYSESFEADWGNMRDKGYYLTFDGSGGGSRNWFKNRSYATGVTSNIAVDNTLLDGHIGGNITKSSTHVHVWFLYNNSTSTTGLNDYFYYKDLQIEQQPVTTPYVNGTRSDTASLIDLKKTSSIDVGNVNFDSTGQPEFDGSDAYINVPYSSVLDTPIGATYEMVFYPTGHGEMLSRGISDSGTSPDNPRIYWGTNGSIYFDWSIQGQDTYVVTSAADCPANQYSYIACTALPGQQLRVYVNGVEATYTTNVQTLPTPIPNTNHPIVIGGVSWVPRYFAGKIPVVKLYNKALTATEIKQNYNAYKNRFNI